MVPVYTPLLLVILVAAALVATFFILSELLGTRNMTPEKAEPYECGMPTQGARHLRVSVRFFLVAIMFAVFDIEAVFLYPWSAMFRQLGWFGLMEMLAFMVVLGVTLVYALKKGAFEWER
jgi:NADH-quinone oxidoreductase subunit A